MKRRRVGRSISRRGRSGGVAGDGDQVVRNPRPIGAALDAVSAAVARAVHVEGVFEARDARFSACTPCTCTAERTTTLAFEPRDGAVTGFWNRDARDAHRFRGAHVFERKKASIRCEHARWSLEDAAVMLNRRYEQCGVVLGHDSDVGDDAAFGFLRSIWSTDIHSTRAPALSRVTRFRKTAPLPPAWLCISNPLDAAFERTLGDVQAKERVAHPLAQAPATSRSLAPPPPARGTVRSEPGWLARAA